MLCTRDEQVGQKIAVMASKGMRRAPLSDFIDVSDELARAMTDVYIYGKHSTINVHYYVQWYVHAVWHELYHNNTKDDDDDCYK